MDKERAMSMMINSLEANGEIKLVSQGMDIYIHSIDPKEGYSYITPDGIEFDSSKEAVDWAVCQFKGLENIGRWE